MLLRPVSTLLTFSPATRAAADAGFGLALAGVALALRAFLPRVPLRTLAGGCAGALVGALAARVLWGLWPEAAAGVPPVWRGLGSLALLYTGAAVGAAKGAAFRPHALKQLWLEGQSSSTSKIVDTSVIIDGRLADVIDTGFLDGRLIVPHFVLRELQQVADSSDPLKRARGRKGLETLNNIKKMPSVQVEIPQTDFPAIPEVDLKLIELARRTGGKVITNDFNLNKVARVRDVPVLNINELANALKPVVLPGEPMKVFILKEGKEPNQGVAYLDDGTMVVVDDGRPLVGQTVDIVITSVLQTTAGKMFFGRQDQAEVSGERRGAVS